MIRENVKKINDFEIFNSPLKKIKAYGKNDWRSFENVANYHGDPKMCNENL